MRWVIKKGDVVKESRPSKFTFNNHSPVALGHPKDTTFAIMCCLEKHNTVSPHTKTVVCVFPLGSEYD